MDLRVSFRLKISESCLQMLMRLWELVYTQSCPSTKMKLKSFSSGFKRRLWLANNRIFYIAGSAPGKYEANPVSWLAAWAGRMGPSSLLWSRTKKKKCLKRTYNVRNFCTISAQKATEDSQMSYVNVRTRPLLNFPRPWKWYYKIAWLSRYILNRINPAWFECKQKFAVSLL